MVTRFDRTDREGQSVQFEVRTDAQPVANDARIAVIVAHGMGQQVPFQTLGEFVEGARQAAAAPGSTVQATTRFVAGATGNPTRLSRLETTLTLNGEPTRVDFYEVYWAPHTEGVSTLRDVIRFLLGAGVRRLRRQPFQRWVDGDFRSYAIPSRIQAYLLAALLVVLGLVALNTVIAAGLVSAMSKASLAAIANLTWRDLLIGLGWVVLGLLSWLVRRLLVQYVGDVAVYVEAQSLDRFGQARTAIRESAATIARTVYGLHYDHIALVGHSLGSVVTYDTLNHLLLEDGSRRARTRLLFTFGSPLDKTAYLFGSQVVGNSARELLAASLQPLIQTTANRPRWVNVYSRMDIIGGALDYYDNPDVPSDAPSRVRNLIDPDASRLIAAHVQHWKSPFLYGTFVRTLEAEILASGVTQSPRPAAAPPPGFPHVPHK